MLLYNVKKEEMRIGKHKGKTMYYASPIAQDKITTKQLEDRIVNATALSRADVRSAITALAKIVREEMLSGRTVDLANLGSFKVVSNGKRVETEKAVNRRNSQNTTHSVFSQTRNAQSGKKRTACGDT